VAPSGVAPSAGPSATDPEPLSVMRSQDDSERRARIAELIATYGEAVYGFCLRMVRDDATAHDIWQQTFFEAYRDLDRFEGRASVRTWLVGIARHRCLDTLKRIGRLRKRIESDEEAVLAHADPDAGPGERLDRARLLAALERCIERLPDHMRAALLERLATGATYEELADALGATANTLQARVARAYKHLKQCLEKQGWTDD